MKLIKKISAIALGLAMAAGVGASVGHKSKEVHADGKTPIVIDSTYLGLSSNITSETTLTATDSITYVTAPSATTLKVAPTNLASGVKNNLSTEKPFIIGKSGAYFYNTAAMPYDIVSVDVYQNGGSASTNVKVSIEFGTSSLTTKGEGTVAVQLSTVDKVYTFDCATEGAKYFRLNVENAYNAQLQLRVNFEKAISVTGVTLDKDSATIVAGKTLGLTATVAPANASNKTISWSSENESIATVNNGVVTGVSAGTTNIVVETEDGEFTDSCSVTVTANPYKVDTLNVTSLGFPSSYGNTEEKTIVSSAAYIANGTTNSGNMQMRSTNSNSGIVSLHTGGVIKCISVNVASGTKTWQIFGKNTAYEAVTDLYSADNKGTLITSGSGSVVDFVPEENYQYFGFCSSDGALYISSIVIEWEPVKPLSINAEDAITLTIDGSKKLGYSLVNNDLIVSETEVEFSSDNAAVSVTDKGVITGVSLGTANVTIKSKANENVTKTIAVTVSPKIPVKSVTLDKSELVVKETHTEELVATVLPEEASIKTVTWSSDHEEVATVDQDGKVTGVKAGTATITVKSTDDDTKYAVCAVTVEKREVVHFAKAETTTALIEGGKYIIVGEKDGVSYVMAHYVSGNNVRSSDAELNTEDTIPVAIKEDIEDCFYTLVANDDGTWSFFDGEKYLYAAGTGTNNNLKTTTTIDGKAKFAITFDDSGLVSVIAQDDTVNANLRFNKGNELFSCYGVDKDGSVKMDQIYLYGVVENQNTANAFAQNFMIQTNLVCSGEADVDRSQKLASMWDGFKESYQALEIEENGKFLEATPSALIEAMLKRYDYIVAKYSLENFITGHKVSPLNNRVYYVGKQNNDSAVTIIAIVSVVSVTCLGVLVTLKKRKTITK